MNSRKLQHSWGLDLRIVLLAAAVALVGCEGDETNNFGASETAGVAGDTDGDGLMDAEERELGTSIRSTDTDGDGFSDFEEVVEFGFNAENGQGTSPRTDPVRLGRGGAGRGESQPSVGLSALLAQGSAKSS